MSGPRGQGGIIRSHARFRATGAGAGSRPRRNCARAGRCGLERRRDPGRAGGLGQARGDAACSPPAALRVGPRGGVFRADVRGAGDGGVESGAAGLCADRRGDSRSDRSVSPRSRVDAVADGGAAGVSAAVSVSGPADGPHRAARRGRARIGAAAAVCIGDAADRAADADGGPGHVDLCAAVGRSDPAFPGAGGAGRGRGRAGAGLLPDRSG